MVKLKRPISESKVASVHWNLFDECHPLTHIHCLPLVIKISVPIGGKVQKFYFRLELDLHLNFNASCALLAHFEAFDNFENFFSNVDMSGIGHRFELFVRVCDPTSSAKQ